MLRLKKIASKLRRENGFAILFTVTILSIILLTIGSLVMGITLSINRDSHQASHQSATLSAVQSGLEASLTDIQSQCSPAESTCYEVLLNSPWSSPKTQILGDACYQYWYGKKDFAKKTIQIHVLAASPYGEVSSGSGNECDLRNAIAPSEGGEAVINDVDGKLTALVATVDLNEPKTRPNLATSDPSDTLPNIPRVLKLRWSEDYDQR